MNATPETIEQVSRFRDVLVKAFLKMIKGINVELSDKGKEEYEKAGLSEGRWYFIKSINEDESITLVSQKHHIFENLNISHIKL